jgi:hypothetical protein
MPRMDCARSKASGIRTTSLTHASNLGYTRPGRPLFPMVMPFLINRLASSALTTLSQSDSRRIRSRILSPYHSLAYYSRALSAPARVIKLRPHIIYAWNVTLPNTAKWFSPKGVVERVP